ncbi:MAG: hypothetical protein NDP16_06115 [Crenarchaeota archaeon]|nr:hypothetical protein [Thermoproteota archaeon]
MINQLSNSTMLLRQGMIYSNLRWSERARSHLEEKDLLRDAEKIFGGENH